MSASNLWKHGWKDYHINLISVSVYMNKRWNNYFFNLIKSLHQLLKTLKINFNFFWQILNVNCMWTNCVTQKTQDFLILRNMYKKKILLRERSRKGMIIRKWKIKALGKLKWIMPIRCDKNKIHSVYLHKGSSFNIDFIIFIFLGT